jgi:hypothetical protein
MLADLSLLIWSDYRCRGTFNCRIVGNGGRVPQAGEDDDVSLVSLSQRWDALDQPVREPYKDLLSYVVPIQPSSNVIRHLDV